MKLCDGGRKNELSQRFPIVWERRGMPARDGAGCPKTMTAVQGIVRGTVHISHRLSGFPSNRFIILIALPIAACYTCSVIANYGWREAMTKPQRKEPVWLLTLLFAFAAILAALTVLNRLGDCLMNMLRKEPRKGTAMISTGRPALTAALLGTTSLSMRFSGRKRRCLVGNRMQMQYSPS